MSSSKSRKRRSDSSSSSSSSSESASSESSREYKKRKHSDVASSSDSENDHKSKGRKQNKEKPEEKDGNKQERTEKYKRDHKDTKRLDQKRTERRPSRSRNDKPRRSNEIEERNRDQRHRNDDRDDVRNRNDDREDRHRNVARNDRHRNGNRSDDRRKNDSVRPGRNDRERDRNGSGGRQRSPGRFRGRRNNRSRSKSFDHASAKWGKAEEGNSNEKPSGEKQKPNFGLSGKLTEETNTYKGVVIKYSEPPEARKPKRRWRLYPFKGEKALQTLYIHRESAYLIGRERKVVDLPVDHPSCSKQHAALQYRLVPFTRDDGSVGKRVRPYLIDLESANGTFINNKKIEPKKYVELLEKDVIKFGFSSREYVLLHENSKDDALDDDVKLEEEDVKVKKEEHNT